MTHSYYYSTSLGIILVNPTSRYLVQVYTRGRACTRRGNVYTREFIRYHKLLFTKIENGLFHRLKYESDKLLLYARRGKLEERSATCERGLIKYLQYPMRYARRRHREWRLQRCTRSGSA